MEKTTIFIQQLFQLIEFSKTQKTEAVSNAYLRDTKLHGVVVQGANLKYCDMSGAAFGELAYKQFDNAVLSCAYSSNGKLFTVALGTNVILLSVTPSGALGDILQTLQGHTDVVTSVAFSSDNKWVASGSGDNSVRLWCIDDPAKNQTLQGHTSYVTSVAFSSDNKWVASGSDDKSVRLWCIDDPAKNQTLQGHTDCVRSVAFSSDNKWVASGSGDKSVRLWCIDDPSTKEVLSQEAANDDGRVLLKQQVEAGRENLKAVTNFGVCSVSYNEVGSHSYLATGGDDRSVCLWEHDREANKSALIWASCQTLCAIEADITSTILSRNNAELLKQRGATGEPKIIE